MTKSIEFLQRWYKSLCNGTWEKDHVIRIETVANPGWLLEVDLRETKYVNKLFDTIEDFSEEDGYIRCAVENGQFQGTGSPWLLGSILNIFCKWIDNSYKEEEDLLVSYFQEWFQSCFNESWEYNKNFEIATIDNPGWWMSINLEETDLEDEQFDKEIIERTKENWVHCFVREGKFEGVGGPENLLELVSCLKKISKIKIKWESVKRFEGADLSHKSFNRVEKQWIETPHIHSRFVAGGVREPEDWEIPK